MPRNILIYLDPVYDLDPPGGIFKGRIFFSDVPIIAKPPTSVRKN